MEKKTSKKVEEKTADKFVQVAKDGESIFIHPSQVEQHSRLGWEVVE